MTRCRRASRALLLALLALACAAALLPAAASAGVRPLNTGISNVYSNEDVAFAHVRETGSTLTLSAVRWRVIAPTKPPAIWNPEDPADPNYEWDFIDKWVRGAVNAGLTPVLQIRSAPAWAERCVPGPETEAVCNPDPAALAAFTKAVVKRFSGSFGNLPDVDYWEGMNEPNLFIFFEPQYQGDQPVSPYLYRTLVNSFYAAVKSVDPTDLVLAPALAPVASPGTTIGPMRFTRLMLCMKGHHDPHPTAGDCEGGVHFDIFDIHPYTTGSPTHEGGPNDVEMGDLAKLQELLAAADKAGRIKGAFKRTPLWITEFSYDSKPPDPGGLAMRIERQWIAEALYQAWTNRVSSFMWYSLEDEAPKPGVPFSQSSQSGLYFWAPTVAAEVPKPAMYAYRFPFVAFRHSKGLRFWGRTPDSVPGKIVLQARRKGGWSKLGVARADAAGIFSGFLRSGYGRGKKGAVRARYGKSVSPGFPMRRVGDFPQPPFG
jgi:hypothetical protein